METLLLLQPRDTSATGKSSQEVILEMVSSILDKKEVPELLEINLGHK